MKALMKSKLILLTLAGTLFATLAVAQPAVEWSGGQTTYTTDQNVYTLGYRFKVTAASDIEAAALGAYDKDGNGLGLPHTVAIWPVGGGAPLVTATVPSGTNAYLEGHFRYVTITPVRLIKNTEYIIGASDFSGPDSTNDLVAVFVGGFTNALGIQWLNSQQMGGPGLNFPSDNNNTYGYGIFGGNFKVQAIPHVSIRLSQVEVCWTSETNKQYTVEYQSALTTNTWLTLAGPLPGTGTNNCIQDALAPGQPQRFYRILTLP